MLDLSSIINIIVNLPAQSSQTENFSLAMFMSKNTVISTADRVKSFGSINELIAAGFAENSTEVAAAKLYFGQTNSPSKLLIGVQGEEETASAALAACREADTTWYICVPLSATKEDIVSMASYIETAKPVSLMFVTTADADVKTNSKDNLCDLLKKNDYKRTLVQYSTSANAVASIVGYTCGENSGTQSFDLDLKSEPGVAVEPLNSTDVALLDSSSCNYYVNIEGQYNLFMKGNMVNGVPCDEIIGVDMITAQIKQSIMSSLVADPKVPLSDAGIALVVSDIAAVCDTAKDSNFIKSGTWNGGNVLNLKNGDSLTNGYSIQVSSVNELTAAQKAQREAPPIYVCLILSDSARSFTITVNVSR